MFYCKNIHPLLFTNTFFLFGGSVLLIPDDRAPRQEIIFIRAWQKGKTPYVESDTFLALLTILSITGDLQNFFVKFLEAQFNCLNGLQ